MLPLAHTTRPCRTDSTIVTDPLLAPALLDPQSGPAPRGHERLGKPLLARWSALGWANLASNSANLASTSANLASSSCEKRPAYQWSCGGPSTSSYAYAYAYSELIRAASLGASGREPGLELKG